MFLSFRNGYCRPMKAVFWIANFPLNFLYRYKTFFFLERKFSNLQIFPSVILNNFFLFIFFISDQKLGRLPAHAKLVFSV